VDFLPARESPKYQLATCRPSVPEEEFEFVYTECTQCIDGPTTESAIPPKVVVEEEAQNKEATGCRKSKAISREMAQRPGMVKTQVS
jgi:hypothetical protein